MIGIIVVLVVKFVVIPRQDEQRQSTQMMGAARNSDSMQSAIFNNNNMGYYAPPPQQQQQQTNSYNEAALQAAMYDSSASSAQRRPTETYASFPQGGMGAGGFAVLAVLAALATFGLLDATPPSAVASVREFEYMGCLVLDRDIDYRASWGVWNEKLRVKLEGNVNGYLAFGLSPDGTMDASGLDGFGSDIVLGWIDDGACSAGCVADYSANQHSKPKLDDSNDVTLISASRVGGRLTIEFERALNSNDNREDRDIQVGTPMNVIFAAQKDNAPLRKDSFARHTHIPARTAIDVERHPIDFGSSKYSCDETGGYFFRFRLFIF